MKKLGIIGAVEQEIALLKTVFEGKEIEVAGLKFFDGTIRGASVCFVCSGVGKVNAAMCAQILNSQFKVDAIINTGAAGALAEDLKIFDLVLSNDAVQYDVDATHFGHALGEVPGMPSPFWKADKTLLQVAMTAFKTLQKMGQIPKTIKAVPGRIATADIFVSDEKTRNFIVKNFSAHCAEMEGAAIAQVCALNLCPFLIIRSMSDDSGKTEAASITYNEFSEKAAHTAANLLLEMLKTWK